MTMLQEAIDKIGWAMVDSDAPTGMTDDRTWHQLLAKFADRGYARLLASESEDVTLALEFAHPELESKDLLGVLGTRWSVAERVLVAEIDANVFHVLIHLDKIVSIVASDSSDVEEELAELGALEENDEPETADSAEQKEDDDRPSFEAPEEAIEDDSPFEEIGDDEADKETTEDPFQFATVETTSHIDVALGFSKPMETPTYGRLEETLTRNLRARFDVTAHAIAHPDSKADLDFHFIHTMYLRVVPDDTSDAGLSNAAQVVREYFDKIDGLAESGIDPLVFLGVSDKISAVRSESTEPANDIGVEDEEDGDEESAGEFVLSLGSEESDALVSGEFENQKLRQPDATTALVDVVLRHPGYSDRNISQVLSLLLSIEYHAALEIIEKAPAVIAWGVARERGLTMKTVIEGAGGKVYLAEPGTFEVD